MKQTQLQPLATVLILLAILCSGALHALPKDGPAPAFSLPANPSGKLSLSDYQGQVVMLNFWASWCGPCRQEFPLLDDLHQRYKDLGFTVLGVSNDIKKEDALKMLAEVPVTFPVAFDTNSKVSELYQLQSMPSTFMIDRKGNIRATFLGYKPGYEVKYETIIRTLVKE